MCLGKVSMLFDQNLKNFTFCALSWYFVCSLLVSNNGKQAKNNIKYAIFFALCHVKGRTQSTKKLYKIHYFQEFVQKPSKLFPESFWVSLGSLEPPKRSFCNFWRNFKIAFSHIFPIPVCFLLLLEHRCKVGQSKVSQAKKCQDSA